MTRYVVRICGETLQRYGVSVDLMRAIKAMYQVIEACVRVEMVKCQNGLR